MNLNIGISKVYEMCYCSLKAFIREGKGEKEDPISVFGSLLKCTDQSEFPICLANEMITYRGNMNGFDEASFLMQSSGLEGGACACVCVSVWIPLPAGTALFQQLSSSCWKRCLCVCVCLSKGQ